MNYNKVIYVILGVACLVGFALIYVLLIDRGQQTLLPSQWRIFAAFGLPVFLASVLPIVIYRVRRTPGSPPEGQSDSDLRFMLTLIAVLGPLTFLAVWMIPVFGSLVIMVVPIAYAIRSPRRRQTTANDRNA